MATKQTTKKQTVKRRKRLQGIVVSNIVPKTLTVRVEIKYAHPKYTKIMSSHKKYQVHYKGEGVEIGDKVIIEEGRPLSKNKSFYFIEKVS